MFQFHGECDLVLVHSDHVNGDKKLDVHVRTVIHEWWSQIESAALRIGDVTLQMDVDKLFVNGQEFSDKDLPMKTAEFVISEPFEGAHFTEAVHGSENHVLKTYAVTFNDKSVVTFKVLDGFMNVVISGHKHDFEHSVGLMGDYFHGKPYTRAGERMYDLHEFSLEWQVDPRIDPVLFVESKGPQLPAEQCRMPGVAKIERRRLRGQENAKLFGQARNACAGKDEFDACMNDIMATNNLNMALLH
jgi:hypothetical protein